MSALRITDLSGPALPPAPPKLRIVRPPVGPAAAPRQKRRPPSKPAPQKKRATEHELANAQVGLTCERSERCRGLSRWASCQVRIRWRLLDTENTEATCDPFDRAHNVRGLRGDLVPAAAGIGRTGWSRARVTVEQSRPRCYPASSMTISGVGTDSMFDELYERQCRLEGVPGIGVQDQSSTCGRMVRTMAMHASSLACPIQQRDLLQQHTRQRPISRADIERR